MNDGKRDVFTARMFRRQFLPAVISALGLTLADMADAIAVGQRVGAAGLAAMGLALPVYMAVNVAAFGLGIGGSVRFAKCMGEGKSREAADGFSQTLETALLAGTLAGALGLLLLRVLLAALGVTPGDGTVYGLCRAYVGILLLGLPVLMTSPLLDYYLRNDDNEKLAGIAVTVGNAADLALNLLLVLVLGLGAAGAALATVLGQGITIVICLPGLGRRSHSLHFRWQRICWRDMWSSFRTGFSTSVEHIWQLLFLLIVNRALMSRTGENGVAVFDMIQNVSYLLANIYQAAVKAMQPLVSTYWSERNEEGMRSALALGIRSGAAIGVAAAALMCLFPLAVCRVFGMDSPELVRMSADAIRFYCAGGLAAGINWLLEGYFQAGGLEGSAFLLATLRGAVIRIPCALLLMPFGLPALWLMYPITEAASLALLLLWRAGRRAEHFDRDRIYSRIIQSRYEELGEMMLEVEDFCSRWEAQPRQIYFVNMTVEEICAGIIEKGFQADGTDYMQVTLIAVEDGDFEFHIRYHAGDFNPFEMTNGVFGEEDFDEAAMGMSIIRKTAKDFFYRGYQGFNTLTVRI